MRPLGPASIHFEKGGRFLSDGSRAEWLCRSHGGWRWRTRPPRTWPHSVVTELGLAILASGWTISWHRPQRRFDATFGGRPEAICPMYVLQVRRFSDRRLAYWAAFRGHPKFPAVSGDLLALPTLDPAGGSVNAYVGIYRIRRLWVEPPVRDPGTQPREQFLCPESMMGPTRAPDTWRYWYAP